MKVLLANYHLAQRAGSELYTLELSTALRDAGHTVGVFTFEPGAIAQEIRAAGIPVFSLRDGAAIEAFAPDLVHAHHAPCLHFLAARALACPVVHGMLGPEVSFERPPSVFDGVSLGLVVSEEVRASAAGTPFGRAVELRVLRNWFDDRGLARPGVREKPAVQRVVVISNHLDAQLAHELRGIASRRQGFSWLHWGAPDRVQTITPTALEPFDAVISIGRTALLAGALGKPCLLYDMHGCDGWLEAERMPALAQRNFSGRLSRARPPLESLLFEPVDVAAVADACWAGYRLTARVAELTAHYADAVKKGPRLSADARTAHGALGGVLADMRISADQQLVLRAQQVMLLEREREASELALRSARLERDVLIRRVLALGDELKLLRASAGMQLVEKAKRVPGLYTAWLRSKRWLRG